MLVEVAKRRVSPGAHIRRKLVAVGVGPVVPSPGAEDAPMRFLAQNRGVADVAITVEFVNATWRARREVQRSAVLVVLLIPIAGSVSLVVKPPAAAQIGVKSDVLEIRLNVIK